MWLIKLIYRCVLTQHAHKIYFLPTKFIWSRSIHNVINKINFIGVFLLIAPIKLISWRSQIASSEAKAYPNSWIGWLLLVFDSFLALRSKAIVQAFLATNALQWDFQHTHAIWHLLHVSWQLICASLQGNSADLPRYNASQQDLQPA